MATWIEALRIWNAKQTHSWEIPRKGTAGHKEVKRIYNEMKSAEDSKGSGMRTYGGATLGETAAAAVVDAVNNPTKALKKAYKKGKKGKKAIEDAYNRSLPRLLKGDMTSLNRLLKSKSIGDFLVDEGKRAASKQATEASMQAVNKVNELASEFTKRLPNLAGKFMFGSGHCKPPGKFTKKDIENINMVAKKCECMHGGDIFTDIATTFAQDPIGSIKKALQFQNAQSGFKKLLDSNTDPNKPKRLFVPPWEL